MDRSKSGYLVETKGGKIGRTFHSKGMVNGKVPVYLGNDYEDINEGVDKSPFMFPKSFSETAVLCDKDSLKVIGFID